jgi:site-specific recombinase XerD
MKKPAPKKLKTAKSEKSKKSKKSKKLNKPPLRKSNKILRTREYLTEQEIKDLRKAARGLGRHRHRDDTLIMLMFRHAFRVSEVASLRWDQIDMKKGLLHVSRMKNGRNSTHPMRGPELRALRQLKREYMDSPYVFISERCAPLSTRTLHHIIARAGQAAGFAFTIHPHMLRHSTGFYLANKGQDTRAIQQYMGHANINNTILYTALSPERFNEFWDD